MSAAVIAAILASTLGTVASAQERPQAAQDKPQARQQAQRIYGSQLMTAEERTEYRQKMRAAKSPEEREKIRLEHHARMQQRAKEKGVTLPDEPPAKGPGRGMGPGGGMGPGRGGR
jgi:hypothetical protein